jgi:hypothetical protein
VKVNLSNIYEVLQTSWEVVLYLMAATKGTDLSLNYGVLSFQLEE